ncbi:MAG: tetratricopeptide repeat protein [Planctomycetaceae bacterium]|jgi:tetratricopeptide (TPR) repeat protein|nr:tetratricopeptide repeat protein [Planctomycetaceae bacterium]
MQLFFKLFSSCLSGFFNLYPSHLKIRDAEYGSAVSRSVCSLAKPIVCTGFGICVVLMLLTFASCNKLPQSSTTKEPQIVTTDPRTLPEVEADWKKAIEAFNKSDINGAKNILADLYKKHPALPPPGINLAIFFAQTKNGNIIKPLLDMTTNETPEDPEAYILLGEIALQQRELTVASLLLKEGEAKLAKYVVYPQRKKNLTSSLLRIQSALAEIRGKWELYGQLADKRITHDGELPALLRQKGVALFQLKKESEAATLFARADKIATDEKQNNAEQGLPAEAMLSQLYAARGDKENAKKYLTDALSKHPNSKEVILLSIQSRLNDDKPEEARELANKLVKDFPDFEPATGILAMIALYLSDYPTAENLFQKLIVASPSNGQAVNGLALALCEQNDTKKLQRAFEYAGDNVNKNQQNTEYLGTLGWILFKAKKFGDARQALQRSVVSGQTSPTNAYYLANLEKQTGNEKSKEEAKRLLNEALKSPAPFAKRREAIKLLEELQK